MKLNKASWHFKLHKLLYGRYAKEPRNFCPYFWKTIVLGILLVVPLSIFCVPAKILDLMMLDEDEIQPDFSIKGYFSEYLLYAGFLNCALFMVYSMVAMWFVAWEKQGSVVHYAGGAAWVILILIGFFYFRGKWLESRSTFRATKERKPNVIVEGLKAWYNKNCPIIEWEEN